MTVGVLVPAEAIPSIKESPFWPSLKAMAHTIPYDVRILGDNMAGKPLSERSVVHRHGPDARDRRRGEPAVVAERGPGARRRPPERPAL